MTNLTVTMNNQEAAVKKTETEMSGYKSSLQNVSEAEKLAAKNGTDVETELKKVSESADKADKSTSGLAEKLRGGLVTAAKAGIAALAGVTVALVGLGKKAIENYSDYEQLVGGVETLFGAGGKSIEEYAKSVGKSVSQVKGEYSKLTKSQDAVIKNASNAYKTAGLSANDYMETVTSFSASLLQGLNGDTAKAAAIADKAVVDMSDNANKMGTDMQSIQNALTFRAA